MRTLLILCFLLTSSLFAQRLDSGPMLGHVAHEEVSIWMRTKAGADVELRYRPKPKSAGRDVPWKTMKLRSTLEDDLCLKFRIEGLKPGTEYEYKVRVEESDEVRPYPLTFKTLVHWLHRRPAPDLTVAIGSCAYFNDKPYDRPGKAYGGSPKIFETVSKAKPDLMIWLGDNVYFRAPDWTSRSGMSRRYAFARRTPDLQRLLATTHHYAIWDDHDFGPNNSDRTFGGKLESLKVFKRYWLNPRFGQDKAQGIYTRFARSDVEFFLLDNRFHRSPNKEPGSPKKTMFGRHQLDWLLDCLTSSKARFKIIAAGNQMLNPVTLFEGWGEFEDERKAFLHELHARRINGVVFISGDRHHTELIRINRAEAYPLYDYTSSPLLSGVFRSEREAKNESRVKGTWLHSKRNFGILRFHKVGAERVLRMEAHDRDGVIHWTHEVKASELKYSNK